MRQALVPVQIAIREGLGAGWGFYDLEMTVILPIQRIRSDSHLTRTVRLTQSSPCLLDERGLKGLASEKANRG